MRPPYEAGAGSIHLVIVRTANRVSSNECQIPSGFDFVLSQSHGFPETPLDTVAYDGISDPATDRKPIATIREIVGQNTKDQ